MAISTNSVIHYTESLVNIKGILKDGFKVKYCSEHLTTKGGNFTGAYAMVSFCDIPLSEIKKHLDSYGYYGIGLSKDWAKREGLNPVLYIDNESNIGKRLIDQAKRILQAKLDTVWKEDFVDLMCYTKNYSGDLIRAAGTVNNYKFYDEREWRFVPSKVQLNGVKVGMGVKAYLEDKATHNEKLKDVILKFEPQDISYIIVKKEEEIIDIIKHLRDIFADKCTAIQLETLMTRITAIDQIINDY